MPRLNRGPRLDRRPDGVWEIRFTDAGRSRRYSTGTKDRSEADLALGAFLIERAKTPAPVPTNDEAEPRTVAWALAIYLRVRGDRARSARGIKNSVAKLRARLGDVLIADLTSAHSEDYVDARVAEDGVQRATVRNEITTLLAAIGCVIRRGDLRGVARPLLPRPASAPPKEEWLSPEEVDRLLAGARAEAAAGGWKERRLEYLTHILLRTGARKSSIEQMRPSQVDLRAGTIDTRPFYTTPNKRGAVIPISRALRPWLEKLMIETRGEQYLLREPYCSSRAMTALGARHGVVVSPHLLRHTFASLAVQNGVSLDDVARVLGDRISTVERVYARHLPGRLRHAVDWLNGAAEGDAAAEQDGALPVRYAVRNAQAGC